MWQETHIGKINKNNPSFIWWVIFLLYICNLKQNTMSEKPIYRLVKSYNGHWGLKWNGNPDYDFMPKQVTRDNKAAYNAKSGYGNRNSIRVPSLKRSDKVWRNFYNLFPHIKGEKTFRGCKLKQIK